MKVTRRRKRKPDPFASADWVRSIFASLTAAFPLLSSCKEKELVKLARAIRHVERYSATDTRRGRPSRWPREDLVKVGLKLAQILDRETSGRISVATFVDHYLRILDFPADVLASLSKGEVNLFEAEQLARVTAARLDISQAEAKRKRAEFLSAHLKSRSSGERCAEESMNCCCRPSWRESPQLPPATQSNQVQTWKISTRMIAHICYGNRSSNWDSPSVTSRVRMSRMKTSNN